MALLCAAVLPRVYCLQVIYCAGARSTFTGDLLRVEERGVMTVVKAMQVRASAAPRLPALHALLATLWSVAMPCCPGCPEPWWCEDRSCYCVGLWGTKALGRARRDEGGGWGQGMWEGGMCKFTWRQVG